MQRERNPSGLTHQGRQPGVGLRDHRKESLERQGLVDGDIERDLRERIFLVVGRLDVRRSLRLLAGLALNDGTLGGVEMGEVTLAGGNCRRRKRVPGGPLACGLGRSASISFLEARSTPLPARGVAVKRLKLTGRAVCAEDESCDSNEEEDGDGNDGEADAPGLVRSETAVHERLEGRDLYNEGDLQR